MVIDDTNVENSGRRSTESSSYLADGDSDSIEKLFGSDDDDSKKEMNHLEQISDCEEGELDESEADQ